MSDPREKLNFVVIGTPKAGTTYTYQLLKEHPEIGVSSPKTGLKGGLFRPKESNKVKSLILKTIHSDQSKIKGECKEGYLLLDGSEKLMWENNPKMKIILCYRNPYERAYSNYKHRKSLGDFYSLENTKDYHHIIEYGFYYRNLRRFYSIFPIEQILLLDFDNLKLNPSKYRERLYAFLEVDTDFIPSTEGKQINDTRFKGTWLGRFIHNTLMPIIDSVGLGRFIRSSSAVRSAFYKLGSFVGKHSKTKQDLLSKEEFMKKIEGVYDADLRLLKEKFGVQL